MLQDQNIKGFTLLDLLVVISIVAIVSAVGIPNFMSWNKDRVLRASTEKVVNMINSINTQSQRGSLPFVQVYIKPNGNNPTQIITRGLSRSAYTNRLNSGNPIDCYTSSSFWTSEVDNKTFDVAIHIDRESSICFSQNGTHYKTLGKIKNQLRVTLDEPSNATDQYIIMCTFDNAKKNGGKCPINKAKGLEKPAYLVEWTRFGNVNKFRWSRNGWTRM